MATLNSYFVDSTVTSQYKEKTLLLFHGNSDCANTLQCCVLHTLPVLLVHIRIENKCFWHEI